MSYRSGVLIYAVIGRPWFTRLPPVHRPGGVSWLLHHAEVWAPPERRGAAGRSPHRGPPPGSVVDHRGAAWPSIVAQKARDRSETDPGGPLSGSRTIPHGFSGARGESSVIMGAVLAGGAHRHDHQHPCSLLRPSSS